MNSAHFVKGRSQALPERNVLSNSFLPSGCRPSLSSVALPNYLYFYSVSGHGQLLISSVLWKKSQQVALIHCWWPTAPSAMTFTQRGPQTQRSVCVLLSMCESERMCLRLRPAYTDPSLFARVQLPFLTTEEVPISDSKFTPSFLPRIQAQNTHLPCLLPHIAPS